MSHYDGSIFMSLLAATTILIDSTSENGTKFVTKPTPPAPTIRRGTLARGAPESSAATTTPKRRRHTSALLTARAIGLCHRRPALRAAVGVVRASRSGLSRAGAPN